MALFDRSDKGDKTERNAPPPPKAAEAPPKTEAAKPPEAEPTQPKYPSSGAPLAEESARIGPGLSVEGEVHGEEDLILDGRVKGSLSLGRHQLLVGEAGCARADVSARKVVVFGEVIGDIEASECVELRHTARVKGNVRTPRLRMDEGAELQGRVEMAGGEKKAAQPKTNGAKPPEASGEAAPAPA